MHRLRRLAVAALVVALASAVPIGFGVIQAISAAHTVYPDVDASSPPELPTPSFDPAKPTVAIVVGPTGANIADTLAPYEALASTKALNVYVVAPRREPVTLTGGLQMVPDLDFATLATLLPTGPDAIVVPALPGAGTRTADVEDWLKVQRAQHHPIIASICVGAEVLASAGMLDSRRATAHWLGLIGLRRDYPRVNWQVAQRYVDDGDIITGAGVLSGIDVALRIIERLRDVPAARQAAAAVSWPAYSPSRPATFAQPGLSGRDLPALLSAMYRWDRPTMGVLLTDGVGEIELASAYRPYTELSYLAEPASISLGSEVIRSRHGLVFVGLSAPTDRLDRIVVPGAQAARGHAAGSVTDIPVTYLHEQSGFAFDGALRDIAATYDVASARWVAKSLQYPPSELALQGSSWPWALTVRPILMVVIILVAVALISTYRRTRGTAK